MSNLDVAVIKVDPYLKRAVLMKITGKNLTRDVARITGAKQLGHMELCKIDDVHQMGFRAGKHGRPESFDLGPTPLMVAADASQEKGVPGFRISGKTTVGMALLFGKGQNGMVKTPVDLHWLESNLEWIDADMADAEDDAQD